LSGLGGGLEGKKKATVAGAPPPPTTVLAKRTVPTWAIALIAFGGIVLVAGGLYWLKTRKRKK
jgi:LPXTG-motif cell wall-anchored protein